MTIISFMFPVAARSDALGTIAPGWLGDWTVHWKNSLGEQLAGKSRLSQDEGALLKEEFESESTGDRGGWKGLTLAKFNARSNTWHYAWHDNRGGYCDFIGQFQNQVFSLEFAAAGGTRVKQRMVIQSVTPELATWDCEKYEPRESTWRRVGRIEYRRR